MEIINDYDTMCKCFQERSECGIVFFEQQYVFFTQGSDENHYESWQKILEMTTPGADGSSYLSEGKTGMIAFPGTEPDMQTNYICIYLPPLEKLNCNQIKFLKFILKTMIEYIKPAPTRRQIIDVPALGVSSLDEILKRIELIESKGADIDAFENIVGIPFTDLKEEKNRGHN